MIALFTDGMIAILLVVTIVYCIILSKRLNSFRRNEAEFQSLVSSFNQATARAEDSIIALRETAEHIRGNLHMEVEDAKTLYEDLTFIIERGDSLANRLGGVSSSSGETVADASEAGGDEDNSEADDIESSVRSRAEKELIKTLNASR
ncbi:MAG: hypothetical protein ISR48_02375 [Alphaproteobacteria bacterium]|nr:hypothetical protein [Alphaproteobacteria bacterium]